MKKYLIYLLLPVIFTSCLNKEVDIVLPDYNSQPVVECYLQPGKPYRLLMSKSNGFFDPLAIGDPLAYFESLLYKNAEVSIVYGVDTIQLTEGLQLDPESGKFFNYFADLVVPQGYSENFYLIIRTPDGKEITATTRIPEFVPVDSTVYELNTQETRVTFVNYFQDNLLTKNFYRCMAHVNTLDSVALFSYATDDVLAETATSAYGGLIMNEDGGKVAGSRLINTFIHITEDYYNFLNSVDAAVSAVGNPFGQPGALRTNLKGNANATGIFTGFSMYRDTVELK